MRKAVKMSPGSYLRLLAPTRREPRKEAVAETSVPDKVVVTKMVGDAIRIAARLSTGARPIEINVDRGYFTDDEVQLIVDWTRRVARRKDPEAGLKAI